MTQTTGPSGPQPANALHSLHPDDRKLDADRDQPVRVALIIASTRPGRFGPTIATWCAEQIAHDHAFEVDVLDLAAFDIRSKLDHHPTPAPGSLRPLEELARSLTASHAVIIVTPEYNHSYPGTLKNAIDQFRDEWVIKPIGLVSYGGLSGGLRATEHLRLVFAELHAITIRDTVSFHFPHSQVDHNGSLNATDEGRAAIHTLLTHLGWWARALRSAARAESYPSEVDPSK